MIKDRLTSAAYGLAWAAIKWLPEPMAAWTFERIADQIWRRRGKSVRRLEGNLARVTGIAADDPAMRTLSRTAMRSYMRYYREAFRLPVMSKERIVSGTHVIGGDTLFSTIESRRGVVLALPHTGNWDLAGAWLVHVGYPFTTVAERLKPESLYERFLEFRRGLGMEVLPLTGGAGNVFGTLAQRLRAGGVACLVSDRDLTESGVEVRFFGDTARMVAGPAMLAIQTGAALLPATLWFEGPEWGVRIHEEVPLPEGGTRQERVTAMTQAMAEAFEKGIADHPQDWHMLQRIWVADL